MFDGFYPVSRAEWRRVLWFAVAVMLLTTLPYVIGALAGGDDWHFGGFLFGADDGYSYLAKMRLGARGDWLFTIRYTHEQHDPALLFLPYILLGKLAGLFAGSANLPGALATAFHLARIVFGTTLLLASYRFVACFVRAPATRMLALVLIALGGGFGWLLAILGLDDVLGSLPLDFYVPESYSFLILFGLPHLALARTAMLLGLMLVFRGLDDPGRVRWSIWAGLCWLVMGLCVPFYLAVLYLLLGCWGLAAWARDRRFPWALFWQASRAALITVPVFAYTSYVFLADDVLGDWSGQNQLPAPHPLHYVLGYVILALPAIAGWRWAWKRAASRPAHLLLAIWVLVVPFVVYLPVNVQRRLAEGVIVPVGILAAAGLSLAFPHKRAWRRARRVLLALALPTALLLWLGGTFSVLSQDRPLFRPTAEIDAMRALDAAAPRDAVVLSSKETGNVLPVFADVIAYVGHGPETIHADDKETRAEQFFAGELDPAARAALLAEVDYVFYGELEIPEDGARSLDWAAGLRLLDGFAPDDEYLAFEVPHATD